MKTMISIFVLMLVISIVGCQYEDGKLTIDFNKLKDNSSVGKQSKILNKPITNFEDLDLSSLVGKNITVKGKVGMPGLGTVDGKLYKPLFDNDGFHVSFVPRGKRSITAGEYYTIKGTVMEYQDCDWMYPDNCEMKYYLQEVKP